MKDLSKKILDKLENNYFNVVCVGKDRGEYWAEIETSSPAGEDVIVTVWYDGTGKDFIRQFAQYAEDFDPDEHAKSWIPSMGKGGCPDSIRELLADADAIKNMLCDMAAKLGT